MSELSQRASDRRDAEHIRDDGYRTDEERRLAGRYIALDDVLIAAEAKIERRNATYTKPGEGFVCFHCGERFLTYESAKEHFGEKPDAQPTCFATPSPTIAALEPIQLTESEAAELDAFRAKPSRAEGLTFTPVPTIAAPSPSNDCADKSAVIARVEALESFGAMVELTTRLGTREMVTGAEVEVVSAAQLRAALAERGANDKHE